MPRLSKQRRRCWLKQDPEAAASCECEPEVVRRRRVSRGSDEQQPSWPGGGASRRGQSNCSLAQMRSNRGDPAAVQSEKTTSTAWVGEDSDGASLACPDEKTAVWRRSTTSRTSLVAEGVARKCHVQD
jgi:hypothetical protein